MRLEILHLGNVLKLDVHVVLIFTSLTALHVLKSDATLERDLDLFKSMGVRG